MNNQGQGEHTYRRLTKVLLITLAAVFSILIAGGFLIFKNEAPRPQKKWLIQQEQRSLATHNC